MPRSGRSPWAAREGGPRHGLTSRGGLRGSRRLAGIVTAVALIASGIAGFAATAVVTPTRSATAETSSDSAPSIYPTTYYAYLASGDSLDTSFLAHALANANGLGHHIRITDPTGVVQYECDIAATTAVGSGCTSPSLTGPAGAWKIEDTLSGSTAGAPVILDWNIVVSNAGGTAIPGRVWSNRPSLSQTGSLESETRDMTYWMVNDTGYQYRVNLDGYDGVQSTIQATAFGVANQDCVPTYQSTEASYGADGIGYPTDPDLQVSCDPQFRVFFDQPASDLPATAPSADGTLTVLPPVLTQADLTVNDLAFAPASANSAQGAFTYSIADRFTGPYQLQIDTNGNGSYDDAVDRTVDLAADGSGDYSYDFDGLDGSGNAIADCTLIHARIFFPTVGEIHVTQDDVESRAGIQITALNGENAGDDTIYWDDTDLATDRANTTPQTDGTAGVSSAGGVHGWDYDTNSWGNNRLIDDWTYNPIDYATGEIAIGGQCLDIVKSADRDTVVPGQTITYTITLHNRGDADFTSDNPASFTDDLSSVLDDATYDGDASGGATYNAPTLSWSGPLAAGATQAITYSVTVDDPDTGDQQLTNTVVSASPGSNCSADSTDPSCIVQIPSESYTVAKTASVSNASPGDVVAYTVTVTNTGAVDYTDDAPASFSDDLSAVTDDAAYDDDAAVSYSGGSTADAPSLSGDTLTWSGPLAVGETATITYTVTVDSPDAGDHALTNTVVPTAAGGGCATDGGCTAVTHTPVPSYAVSKTVDKTTVAPGGVVHYTISVTNTGQVAYTADAPASFTDDLSKVTDDATYNGDASNGATVDGSTLSWKGALGIGDTATVTYSFTVKNPNPGDDRLENVVDPGDDGGSCVTDDSCTTNTTVVAHLTASGPTVATGGTAVGSGPVWPMIGTAAAALATLMTLLVLALRRRRADDGA